MSTSSFQNSSSDFLLAVQENNLQDIAVWIVQGVNNAHKVKRGNHD